MKTTLLSIITIALATLLIFSSCNETPLSDGVALEDGQQTETDFFLEKGALLGVHVAIHKEGSSIPASRNFLRYDFFPAWKDLCPGSRVFYLRPDRGPHIGKEGFFWVFQNEEARNVYFPEKDFPTEEFENRRKSVDWLYTDSTFFRFFEFGWNTSGFSADYEVIAMHDSVDKEWLSDDAMIMIRHYPLVEGTDTLALEQFLAEEWATGKSKLGPNVVTAFAKVIRGHRQNEFAQIWVFNSIQERNKQFPYEGTPDDQSSTSDDQIQQKLKTFIDADAAIEEHYEIVY